MPQRPSGFVHRAILAAFFAGLTCAWVASADEPEAGAAAARPSSLEAARVEPASTSEPLDHGWVCIRDHRQQVTHLFHLPPRGLGNGRVPMGSIRPVAAVPQVVDGLATSPFGYIAVLHDEAVRQDSELSGSAEAKSGAVPARKDAPAPTPERQRRVLGQSVSSGPGVFFEYPPGRPEVLPSLPGMPELFGVALTKSGPVALMRDRARGGVAAKESVEQSADEAARPWRLLMLDEGGAGGGTVRAGTGNDDDANRPLRAPPAWRELAPPWAETSEVDLPDQDSMCWLVPWGSDWSGVGVLVLYQDSVGAATGTRERFIDLWTMDLRVQSREGSDEQATKPAWSRTRLPASGTSAPDAWFRVREAGTDHLVSVTWAERGVGGCELHRWSAAGSTLIAKLVDVPREAAITPVGRDGGASGLAMVWFEEPPATGNNDRRGVVNAIPLSTPKRRMIEVTLSGRDLYAGGAMTGRTGLERELELLAWVLVMTMIGVVVFVLRNEQPVRAPRGFEPADPLRRLLAAFMDYLPAAAAAGLVLGVPVRDAILPFQGGPGGPSAAMIGLALLFAAGHTTLCEWLIGRSLGKAAMGLWVVEIPPAGRPADADKTASATEAASVTEMPKPEIAPGPGPADVAAPPLHPPLWSAAVRNVIRWGAPIVGVFMLMDRSRRHPGDIAGRTLVIQLERPSEDE